MDEIDDEMRRGPWTVEEDIALINYIRHHGDGRWNSLARSAGLKRTGKSCRLRWLNYLRPDVRRGNITPQEQLLILQLHSTWGNRWSKIARYLPGRTDNEIKNYWRTRVQKHAKQLKCDVNSEQFRDIVRYLWMPRLEERIQANSASEYLPLSSQLSKNEVDMDQTQGGICMPENSSGGAFWELETSKGNHHYYDTGLDLMMEQGREWINAETSYMNEEMWALQQQFNADSQ